MENDSLARRKKFLIDFLFVAAILAIIYVALKYVVGLIMPFFIALILSAVARPLSKLLSSRSRKVKQKDGTVREVRRKLRLSRSVAAVVSVVIVFLLLAGILFLAGMVLLDKVLDAVEYVPVFFKNTLRPSLENIAVKAEALLTGDNAGGALGLDESTLAILRSAYNGAVSSLGSKLTELSASFLLKISSTATKIPSLLLSVIICVIATVFLSVDFDSIRLFLNRNLPARALKVAREFRDTLVDTVWQFLKSYSLIFLITATEISVGFLLVGQKHAIPLAMLIALFDAFPIVGSGMILMPFSVITMITGNIPKGLGLMAVWIVVVVARQFIEPRIVGHRVGLRPIVTLFGMYVGTQLFGGIGLFAVPILTAILVDLNRRGTIHLFRTLPMENANREDDGKKKVKRHRGVGGKKGKKAGETAGPSNANGKDAGKSPATEGGEEPNETPVTGSEADKSDVPTDGAEAVAEPVGEAPKVEPGDATDKASKGEPDEATDEAEAPDGAAGDALKGEPDEATDGAAE